MFVKFFVVCLSFNNVEILVLSKIFEYCFIVIKQMICTAKL